MNRLLLAAILWGALSACAAAVTVPTTPAPEAIPDSAPTPAEASPKEASELSPSGPLLEGQIELTMVNVGQGDGFILRTAAGVTVVVDAGTGAGGKAIANFLRRQQITAIDLLVLTHPHADHIGGVPHILKAATVAGAWVSGYAGTTRTQAKVLEEFEKRSVPVTAVRRGNKATLDGEVELTVLAPEDPLIQNSRSDANANSVVLWMKHGEIDFLLTGDAESETETRILDVLRGRPPPDFEVLKVAHHGSRHASSNAFLARVHPQIALISCGLNNRYKHPHPDTLERLSEIGAQVFRTDLHGTIRLRSDGENILIVTEKQVRINEPDHPFGTILGKNSLLAVHLPPSLGRLHSVFP